MKVFNKYCFSGVFGTTIITFKDSKLSKYWLTIFDLKGYPETSRTSYVLFEYLTEHLN